MKKKIKFVGIIMIIALWVFTFFTFLYALDKIIKRNSVSNYFDELEKARLESPQYPPVLISWDRGYSGFRPYHEQMFDGYVVKMKPTHIKINSDGIRDREFSLEKPSSTFRIIMLGDSFVFGHGVELDESLPKQLESLLNNRNDNLIYEVLNFGAPGQNTFEEVEMFKDKGLKYSPDLVIIGFLSNDLENESFRRELCEEFNQKYKSEGKDPADYSAEVSRKVLEIAESRMKEIPFDEAWKGVESPLEELALLAKQKGIKVMIYSFLEEEGSKENDALNDFANKHEGFYFAYSVINAMKLLNKDLILHPLDPHPTPLAYKLHAEKIYETLIKQNLIPSD